MTPEFNEWWDSDKLTWINPYGEDTPVYWAWEGYASRDAEIESLRQQLAAMTAERDKAKAMPMKYRRMEFNAQLQNENEALRQQLAEANHAHEFMSQQYLDVLKERNQLRKDVAKLQEALHCKLTWKPS